MNQRIQVIFIVGVIKKIQNRFRSKDEKVLAANFSAEILQYGDILHVNILDSYKNISLKVISLFEYMGSTCPHAKFYFKGDDDIILNPWNLINRLQVLSSQIPNKLFLFGANITDAAPIRKMKNDFLFSDTEIEKWNIPIYIYPCKFWGFPYLAGAGFIISNAALKLLTIAGKCINLLYIDDVMITGWMRYHLNIDLISNSDFSWVKLNIDLHEAVKYILLPDLEPCELRILWEQITNGKMSIDQPECKSARSNAQSRSTGFDFPLNPFRFPFKLKVN